LFEPQLLNLVMMFIRDAVGLNAQGVGLPLAAREAKTDSSAAKRLS